MKSFLKAGIQDTKIVNNVFMREEKVEEELEGEEGEVVVRKKRKKTQEKLKEKQKEKQKERQKKM